MNKVIFIDVIETSDMNLLLFLKKVMSSITGISTPFFGITWDSSKVFNHKVRREMGSRKNKLIYKRDNISLDVVKNKPRKVSLPIDIKKFHRLSSQIVLNDSDNVRWRVGYRLIDASNTKREYIFHVYQDNADGFHSRIVEQVHGQEIPDVRKSYLEVSNTKNFILTIEAQNDKVAFYVNKLWLGEYSINLQNISDLMVSAWSHENAIPIKVEFKNIRIWSRENVGEEVAKIAKKKDGKKQNSEPNQKKGDRANSLFGNHISVGRDIIIGDQSANKGFNEKSLHTNWYNQWWAIAIFFPLVVGYLIYSFGWNGQKNINFDSQNPSTVQIPPVVIISSTPTSTMVPTVADEPKKIRVSLGDSYKDPLSNITMGVSNINVSKTTDISITIPDTETDYYKDIVPGKVFYLQNNGKKYTLTIKAINYVYSYVDIIIN